MLRNSVLVIIKEILKMGTKLAGYSICSFNYLGSLKL